MNFLKKEFRAAGSFFKPSLIVVARGEKRAWGADEDVPALR